MKRFTKTAPGPLGTVPGMANKQRTTHAFKGLQDWIEVFAAGTHKDSKGREASFTTADLDQMVANVQGEGVPAVLGHPKQADPAYAWAKPGAVKRDGERLLVKFSEINPDFEAGVNSGAYRNRSISIYKDPALGWVPQHIGWLGAAAPAISGLKPLAYAAPAEPEAVFEFGAFDTGGALQDVAGVLRGLRDWLIGEKGLDTADRVLPGWTIDSVAAAGARINADALEDLQEGNDTDDAAGAASTTGMGPAFNRTGVQDMTTTITEADLERARTEAAAAATTAATAQFAAQGAELAELRAERHAERIGVQINGWKAAGLVLPAEEHGLAEFMAALEGGTAAEFNFAAADKSAAKKTPAAWFADFVAGRKALLKLGTTSTAGDGGEPGLDTSDYRAVAKAATEYQAKEALAGRAVDIAEAVAHITNRQAV